MSPDDAAKQQALQLGNTDSVNNSGNTTTNNNTLNVKESSAANQIQGALGAQQAAVQPR